MWLTQSAQTRIITTESQQQIAREARDQVRTYFNVTFSLPKDEEDKVYAIILSAIERAVKEAREPSEIAGIKVRWPAQPQRSEQCLVGYKAFMVCERGTKGCIAHHEQVLQRSEQQEWTPNAAHDISDGQRCLGVNLEYDDAKKIKDTHNAELADERQAYETKLQGAEDDAQSWHERFEASQQELVAEREKVENLHKILGQKRKIIKDEREKVEQATDRYCLAVEAHAETKQELVAERQRREHATENSKHYRELFDEIRQAVRPLTHTDATKKEIIDCVKSLVSQLLSAEAAIDKHNFKSRSRACYVIDIDPSALREHDADLLSSCLAVMKKIPDAVNFGGAGEAYTILSKLVIAKRNANYEIVKCDLFHARCSHDDDHACIVVWSSGAEEQLEAIMSKHDAEVREPLVKALKILLDSARCLAGEEAEIPEEISAQFDINLDDAQKVHDALVKVKE